MLSTTPFLPPTTSTKEPFFLVKHYRLALLLLLVFFFVGLFSYVDHSHIKYAYKQTLIAKDTAAEFIGNLHPALKFLSPAEFSELFANNSAAINELQPKAISNNSSSTNGSVESPDEYPSIFNWPTYCRGRFRTYAVVSADTNVVYSFPLPITVLSWRKICAGTIVLFIGEESKYAKDPKNAVVLRRLRKTGAVIRFIPTIVSDDTASLAQTARMFTAAIKGINVKDDSYLVTTDADMFIIKQSDHIPDQKETVLLFNSRCCGTITKEGMTYRHIPMHTIGMQAWQWREMMGLAANSIVNDKDILNYLEKEFDTKLVRSGKAIPGNQKWYLDQSLVSKKMHMWSLKGTNKQFIKEAIHGTGGRMDRSRWPGANSPIWKNLQGLHETSIQHSMSMSSITLQLSRYGDAHLPHPIHGSRWLSVRKLVNLLLPADQAAWAEAYHQEFMAAH